MTDSFDMLVIGGGAAGLTAAQVAARLDLTTALVDKHKLGGDCTWSGCVPSKALLKAAQVAHDARTAGRFGIQAADPVVDMRAVRDYVQGVVHQIYEEETPEVLHTEAGVSEALEGQAARFIDSHTIQVGERRLRGNKVILTTGSFPFIPPIDGIQDVPYFTNETLFQNDQLPERLLVIGAGPAGCELGQAYARFGAHVTLVDAKLLPRDEPEVRDVLRAVFQREGLHLQTGLVQSAWQEDDGEIVLELEAGGEVRGDALLVAAGRQPNTADLNLDAAGVDYTDEGIVTNPYLQTSQRHIYAAGDCIANGARFTHMAGWQAVRAVRNAVLPGSAKGFPKWLPWTTFTDPEAAHVGWTEEQALELYGPQVKVNMCPISASDRCAAEGESDGFIKIIRSSSQLVGVTIVSGRAGEMIQEYIYAMQKKMSLSDMASIMHPYPTYSYYTHLAASKIAGEELLGGVRGWLVKTMARWLTS